MKFTVGLFLGILLGGIFGTVALAVRAECCGAFNVPFDTQLEIERQQAWAEQQRAFTMPAPTSPYRDEPCERRR